LIRSGRDADVYKCWKSFEALKAEESTFYETEGQAELSKTCLCPKDLGLKVHSRHSGRLRDFSLHNRSKARLTVIPQEVPSASFALMKEVRGSRRWTDKPHVALVQTA
jgi:hypothetical protein